MLQIFVYQHVSKLHVILMFIRLVSLRHIGIKYGNQILLWAVNSVNIDEN